MFCFYSTNGPHFLDRFKAIHPNDAQLSVLSFQLFLSLIFSCPCTHSFVVCLSFCACFSLFLFSLSLSLFLSLGMPMKTMPVLFYFIFFRGRWIFQFCIFSCFLCAPSFFFQASLMCLWIRYHSVWMSSQTQMRGVFLTQCMHAFFIIQTRGIHMRSSNWTCLLGLSMRCSTHIRPYNC